MQDQIIKLTNDDKTKGYLPITAASATYLNDKTTVEEAIQNLKSTKELKFYKYEYYGKHAADFELVTVAPEEGIVWIIAEAQPTGDTIGVGGIEIYRSNTDLCLFRGWFETTAELQYQSVTGAANIHVDANETVIIRYQKTNTLQAQCRYSIISTIPLVWKERAYPVT